MQLLYYLRPEVPGEWAQGTIVTNRERVESGADKYPVVSQLHLRFEGWLGDHLIKAVSCYLASEQIVKATAETDCLSREVQVSHSERFAKELSGRPLPQFLQIIPLGRVDIQKPDFTYSNWSGHEWSLGANAELVVTADVLDLIGIKNILHCEIHSLRPKERKRVKFNM